jgi:hypothetical protein
MTYETIETIKLIIQGIGAKKLGIEEATFENHTSWAATYYSLLIQNFPVKSKSEIIEKSKKAKHKLNFPSLDIARNILLRNGLIAKIYLPEKKFGNEPYLPANPAVIWEENKENIKEGKEFRLDKAEELIKTYKNKFSENGFTEIKDPITILYSSRWFTYTIINNLFIENNVNLNMTLSGLRSFDDSHIKFYEDILSTKKSDAPSLLSSRLPNPPKINALFDPHPYTKNEGKKQEFEERLERARCLMDRYPQNIKIRYINLTHATSRRVVFNSMAIDARKILPFDIEEPLGEPSYVGTIYLEPEQIDFFEKNFADSWEISTDISEYPAKKTT